MADLGDLSDFMKEGSVADLDWLDVDEKSYKEHSPKPQYNLDFSPELEEAWDHEDRLASTFVPNIGSMATSSVSGDKVATDLAARIVRVARTLLMQNPDPNVLIQSLRSKYGSNALRTVKAELADVLRERGLLGRYYIAAEDFPGCGQSNKTSVAFARRFAATARFVKACGSCSGCSHNQGNTCGVFQKKIVMDVPYTDDLAAQIERTQMGSGKSVQASSAEPKERIRLALLASDTAAVAPAQSAKPVVNPAQFLRAATEAPKKVHLPVLSAEKKRLEEVALSWSPTASEGRTASEGATRDKAAFGVVQLLKKEMLKGRGERELLQSLKLSFSVEDLRATRDRWEPLFKEAGLYGTVYSTQDSFDDCHEGADFLARQASSVKGIVAGSKCSGCIHNKMARCLLYGRPLVAKAEDLYTAQVLDQTVREYRQAGRVGSDVVSIDTTVRNTLKQVYRTASVNTQAPALRSHMQAFTGGSLPQVTSGLTQRDVVKTASRFLNEGLYGSDLLSALKGRFDPRDIKASQEALRPILAEQGLQGVFYVNPTVYSDYGKGCDEGARLHRARLVPYVKMASKCTTCVHQTKVGHCSKYNKALVVEPPYQNKAAQQREILASGRSTEVPIASLMDNRSILAQFEMQKEMQVEMDEKVASVDVDIELGTGKVKL